MEVEEAISVRRSETVADSERVRTGVPEGARSFRRMVVGGGEGTMVVMDGGVGARVDRDLGKRSEGGWEEDVDGISSSNSY